MDTKAYGPYGWNKDLGEKPRHVFYGRSGCNKRRRPDDGHVGIPGSKKTVDRHTHAFRNKDEKSQSPVHIRIHGYQYTRHEKTGHGTDTREDKIGS